MPKQKYNQRGYKPSTTRYSMKSGYSPRGTRIQGKRPVKVKVSVKHVLYKGRDFRKAKAIVKKYSRVVRKRGWKLEVIGNPDDPNYHGDYIVRVITDPNNDIVVESIKVK